MSDAETYSGPQENRGYARQNYCKWHSKRIFYASFSMYGAHQFLTSRQTQEPVHSLRKKDRERPTYRAGRGSCGEHTNVRKIVRKTIAVRATEPHRVIGKCLLRKGFRGSHYRIDLSANCAR